MKDKINLNNRETSVWLQKIDDISETKALYKLEAKKEYYLEYMRLGGNFTVDKETNKVIWEKVVMMDPPGGPYMEIGDIIDKNYKIIAMNEYLHLILEYEGNNN